MSNKYYVYKLILNDKNKKFYIGSTSNFKVRKADHIKNLKSGHHRNRPLQKAFDAVGRDLSLIEFEILYVFDNKLDAGKKEEELIRETYDSNYNISKYAYGGDNITYHPEHDRICKLQTKLTQERYDKMSDEEKLKLRLMSLGKKNPNYKTGKYSEEYKTTKSKINKKMYKELGLKNERSLSRYGKEPWNKLSNPDIIKRRDEIGESVIYCEGYLFPNLLYAEYVYDVDLSSRILSKKLASKEFRIATAEDLTKYKYYDITKDFITHRDAKEGTYLRTVMVVWNNILFRSIEDAAKAFDISSTGFMLRVKSKDKKYMLYRYAKDDDIGKLDYYNKLAHDTMIRLEIDKMINTKKVSCLGVVYNSVSEAAKALGINNTTLAWRLRSNNEKFKDYFYIAKQNV